MKDLPKIISWFVFYFFIYTELIFFFWWTVLCNFLLLCNKLLHNLWLKNYTHLLSHISLYLFSRSYKAALKVLASAGNLSEDSSGERSLSSLCGYWQNFSSCRCIALRALVPSWLLPRDYPHFIATWPSPTHHLNSKGSKGENMLSEQSCDLI